MVNLKYFRAELWVDADISILYVDIILKLFNFDSAFSNLL